MCSIKLLQNCNNTRNATSFVTDDLYGMPAAMQQHSQRDVCEHTRLQMFHLLASYILKTYSQWLDTWCRQYVVCSSLVWDTMPKANLPHTS